MKLSQIKALLPTISAVKFKLENGIQVPAHFHITEIGMHTKHFIDCGGTIRNEKKVSFQLWNANDIEHRLSPEKLLKIIELSESKLGIEDEEVEVEYQENTVGVYHVSFDGENFILKYKNTACLASDKCGIPPEKLKVNLSSITRQNDACCTVSSESIKSNCGCNAEVNENINENKKVCC